MSKKLIMNEHIQFMLSFQQVVCQTINNFSFLLPNLYFPILCGYILSRSKGSSLGPGLLVRENYRWEKLWLNEKEKVLHMFFITSRISAIYISFFFFRMRLAECQKLWIIIFRWTDFNGKPTYQGYFMLSSSGIRFTVHSYLYFGWLVSFRAYQPWRVIALCQILFLYISNTWFINEQFVGNIISFGLVGFYGI